MNKAILCYGNEFLKEDSIAAEIAKGIKGFPIRKCTSIDEILDYPKESEVIILDVVRNLKKVVVLHGTKMLKTRQTISMHDFDIAKFMSILEAAKELPKVTIIGIPMQGKKEELQAEVEKILKKLTSN
ncbi:MAG: hypothetical protein V1837_00575 [Candidatus Woesearchaeota archaeon]